MDTVFVGPCQLVADDAAADRADDGARAAITARGDGGAEQRAGASANDRAGDAVVALLLTGRLCSRECRDEGRDGEAGDQNELAHF